MDTIPNIDELLMQITALKGPKLLVAFIIFLGYGLKNIKGIPNEWIPRIGAISAMLLAPVLVAWPDAAAMEPNIRFNDIAAWAQIEIQALFLWAAAWVLHAKVLKPMIDEKLAKMGIKVNGKNGHNPALPLPPDAATPAP